VVRLLLLVGRNEVVAERSDAGPKEDPSSVSFDSHRIEMRRSRVYKRNIRITDECLDEPRR
jgi:hypothetical protein